VALGVIALIVLLLYAGKEAGLAQEVPPVEMNLRARAAGGVVGYSLLLNNQEEGEITLDRIELLLPNSQGYVGLAASSGVSVEPFKEEQALVWSGPFILPGEGSLVLDFWAVALGREASGLSRATVYVGGTAVASAEGEVTVAPWSAPSVAAPVSASLGASSSITVTKSVTPTTTFPNRPVLYTAIFTNTTGSDVALNVITDTFSSSLLRHVGPAPGSDIEDWPEPLGGSSVTWTGPYTVTAGSSLTLAYWAWVGETLEEQPITNSLQAEAGDGSVGPVTETLDIEAGKAFLPLAMKGFSPVLPASLEDHFNSNANNWTPFLNYWRLKPEQWYWDAGGGYPGGGYRHNMYLGGTEAHDALSMYIQEGSQEWTDYRFQARVNLVSGVDIGVWFRGTFVDEGGGNGRKLTGYYFLLDPLHDTLALWQMQTDEECTDCTANYSFSNPMTLVTLSGVPLYLNHWYTIKVEVAGPLIKCYVDDALKIEYNDTVGTTFLQGTVGLFVYKASDARFDDILVESL
jgi:hypothetical protein